MARAAGTIVDGGGAPRFDPARSVPILIHGDAAFPGQGIVAETLNLSRLPGYSTGGTIHVIANNQLGFTTAPEDSYSTSYASGLARGFKIPIVHVNADDPEACVEAARLAFAYRARFQRDFLIDLIGYRRYGHNEGDEPGFTQPLMYQKIAAQPTVREIWGRTLVERGAIDAALADVSVKAYLNELQEAYEKLQPEQDFIEPTPETPPPGAAARVATARAARTAPRAERGAERLPERLHDSSQARTRSREEGAVPRRARTSARSTGRARRNWPTRRFSPTASASGSPARTSSAAPSAIATPCSTTPSPGGVHVPLQTLPQARAAFEIHNSPLTENAVIGFEYGYNIQEPSRLVIWEAQYGDFINGAQVMIDEFIVSARGKWGLRPSLVLLLPHGLRGPGARPCERAARAIPAAGCRHQHPRRQLHDRRAVLPPAATAGGAAHGRPAAARRADAEEPAPAPAGAVHAAAS